MEWGLALSALSTAITAVRQIQEIDKNLSQAELKAQMATIYSAMADVKMALADAQDEMRRKEGEIESLRSRFELRGNLVQKGDYKFFPDENGQPKGGAICPRCESIDALIIKVVRDPAANGMAICPQCKQRYESRGAFA